MFKVFFVELLVMILSTFYCILSFTLLCPEFGIDKNYAVLGVILFA